MNGWQIYGKFNSMPAIGGNIRGIMTNPGRNLVLYQKDRLAHCQTPIIQHKQKELPLFQQIPGTGFPAGTVPQILIKCPIKESQSDCIMSIEIQVHPTLQEE